MYYRAGPAIVAADLVETASGGLTVRGQRRVLEGDLLGGESAPWATYDVAADGRIIQARAIGEAPTPIVVRTGWIAGLKTLMATRQR
jgi:hypothetical protein